jgi:diketogulonate reductase-like aldo/keto reductase
VPVSNRERATRLVRLHDGTVVPTLGLGTWRLGEARRSRNAEVAAVRRALELGYRLVDTAEMYGEGGAEEVVGQALGEALRAGDVKREDVFVVSKVYPHNASTRGMAHACDASRKRLATDAIDLYLLHWRGTQPLAETVDAFEALRASGRIGRWGVSNFDTSDMQELWALEAGRNCVANQIYYSASRRGSEFDLLPWHDKHSVAAMAYCPIDQGTLANDRVLHRLAAARGVTAAQLAIGWVLRRPGVIAIPKAVREEHLRENLAAIGVELSTQDLAEIERAFPAPKRKVPLAMT